MEPATDKVFVGSNYLEISCFLWQITLLQGVFDQKTLGSVRRHYCTVSQVQFVGFDVVYYRISFCLINKTFFLVCVLAVCYVQHSNFDLTLIASALDVNTVEYPVGD